MILRYPYRPYWLASVMIARVRASSSLRKIGVYRCVLRPCPSSRQACRSLNPYSCCARSTAQRRRSGLRSFPAPPRAEPASPGTVQLPTASTGCSLFPVPSAASLGRASARQIPSASGSRSVHRCLSPGPLAPLVLPFAISTSIFRSRFTICSGLYLFLGMTGPPQVNSLSLHLVPKTPVRSMQTK